MTSIERELNSYLFYEFGIDGDESSVSEWWPFRLHQVAKTGEDPIFEFEADNEPYYALVSPGLNFLPKAGMDVNALLLQIEGSHWIGAPSGIDRRKALQSLGSQIVSRRPVEILEGLFLRSERRYLGLFRAVGDSDAIVGGFPRTILVPFPQASAPRRLSWGVGRWLQDEDGAS